MLKRDARYRRLKVSSLGVFASVSYWAGPDHLLIVEVFGFAERYQRFAFNDIQAIIIRKENSRFWLTNLLGGLGAAILLAILGFYLSQSAPELDSAALAGAGVLLALIIGLAGLLVSNWVKGPTCTCHIQTLVQLRPLPCLRRRRKADLLLQELSPAIVRAQNKIGGSVPESGANPP